MILNNSEAMLCLIHPSAKLLNQSFPHLIPIDFSLISFITSSSLSFQIYQFILLTFGFSKYRNCDWMVTFQWSKSWNVIHPSHQNDLFHTYDHSILLICSFNVHTISSIIFNMLRATTTNFCVFISLSQV